MMSPSLGELIICLIPVIGIIIGIIALVVSQRKHQQPDQDAREESDQSTGLSERKPWLNNGFISGLVTGFAAGFGLMAAYLIIPILWGLFGLEGSANSVAGIAFLVGLILAAILAYFANKAVSEYGLNGLFYTGKGIGRLLLAAVGVVVGLFIGIACYTPIVVFRMLTLQ
jgi:uncharacterized membrane-anchored protein YhcB (DUF1043 family)